MLRNSVGNYTYSEPSNYWEKMNSMRPSIVTIDLSAIVHNFRRIKERVGNSVKVMAVVKSDAYGHGMIPVAKRLSSLSEAKPGEMADAFGVSFVHEGVTLREAGITEPIVVLGGVIPGEEKAVIEHRLTPVVSSRETIDYLTKAAKDFGAPAGIHLKADTGMSRLGMGIEEILPVVREFSASPFVRIEGLCTHLAFAFMNDRDKNLAQLKRFDNLVVSLEEAGFSLPLVHACNSAGIFAFPEAHYNMVRPGIALYGSSPFDYPCPGLDLKPAMRWEANIVHIRKLSKGASVSYGGRFTVSRESRIATVPVGYSQGLLRGLSGKVRFLVQGKKLPQVGTICMDFSSVDITDLEDCQVGARVILMGSENGEEVSAQEMAESMGTISYEIYCHVGRLAERRYVDGNILDL